MCKSVLSMMVLKARMKTASAEAKGRPWPRSVKSLPANASMRRSMHCASPGRRKHPRKTRSAALAGVGGGGKGGQYGCDDCTEGTHECSSLLEGAREGEGEGFGVT